MTSSTGPSPPGDGRTANTIAKLKYYSGDCPPLKGVGGGAVSNSSILSKMPCLTGLYICVVADPQSEKIACRNRNTYMKNEPQCKYNSANLLTTWVPCPAVVRELSASMEHKAVCENYSK